MQFGLLPEQEAMREATRRFLAERAPIAWSRARLGLGWDTTMWRLQAEELGWAALTIPEAFGGFELGMVEVVVLQEELGRVLHPSPFYATCCLATPLIVAAGTAGQQAQWLPRIAQGAVTATVGWMSHPRGFGAEGVGGEATLVRDPGTRGSSYELNGTLLAVVDGATADVIVVALRCERDVGLFLVERGAPGLHTTGHTTVDGTRALATVRLDGVRVLESARLVGTTAALATALDLAAIALAAEQLGVAEVAMDMAVEYAKVRHQFGRPIGSFQAIKHTCADLLVLVESARSAAWYAAAVASGDPGPEAGIAANLARAWCTDTAFKVTAENLQIHGGIGFTWEHDAHLYFKRAQATSAMLGDAAWHREQLATRLGW